MGTDGRSSDLWQRLPPDAAIGLHRESSDFTTIPPLAHSKSRRQPENAGQGPGGRKSSWGIRLTDRHVETIELVACCRALTAVQVQIGAGFSLGERSSSACRRVLTSLVRRRYLDVLPRQHVTEPLVYVVTRQTSAGLRLLRARWDDERLRSALVRRGPIEHLLGINDLRVRALRSCHDLGWELRRWDQSEGLLVHLRELGLIPDAYIQVRRPTPQGPRTSAYFLEVERSSKSERVLAAKLTRYSRFYYSGAYEEHFGTRALRVLVVFVPEPGVSTLRRVQRALELCQRLGITLVRATGLDMLRSVPANAVLSAPVWWRPNELEPLSLVAAEKSEPRRGTTNDA